MVATISCEPVCGSLLRLAIKSMTPIAMLLFVLAAQLQEEVAQPTMTVQPAHGFLWNGLSAMIMRELQDEVTARASALGVRVNPTDSRVARKVASAS